MGSRKITISRKRLPEWIDRSYGDAGYAAGDASGGLSGYGDGFGDGYGDGIGKGYGNSAGIYGACYGSGIGKYGTADELSGYGTPRRRTSE